MESSPARYQGRRESALSARGVQQGFALANGHGRGNARRRVSNAFVSQPDAAARARRRQFVAERVNLPRWRPTTRLIEIAHGTWEGRLRDEIAANDPARYATWRERPARRRRSKAANRSRDVLARWQRFPRIVRGDEARRPCIVTHDAIVRIALLDIMGRPLDDILGQVRKSRTRATPSSRSTVRLVDVDRRERSPATSPTCVPTIEKPGPLTRRR